MAASCQVCKEKFGLFTKKDFCRLCGVSICQSCSTKDLLLYISDDDKDSDYRQPRLVIIRIVGCPQKEPEISLYLRICPTCKDKMTQRQMDAFDEEDNLIIGSDFMDNLNKIDQRLKKGEEQVKSQLPKYTSIVESLEDKSRKSEYQNNMKILAKAQTDLADVLAHHVTSVQQLKKLRPVTDCQSSVLKKYIMAIISTQVYLRQLIYETLHLSQTYKLVEQIPTLLIKIDESVEADVVVCLTAAQEDVNKHKNLLKEILQERMKENKMIRVSKSQLLKNGSKYIKDLTNSRVEHILNQILNQLQLASVSRSFSATKKVLEESLESIRNGVVEEDETDFVFVNACG